MGTAEQHLTEPRPAPRPSPRPAVAIAIMAALALIVMGIAPSSAKADGGTPSFTFTSSGWGHGVGMSQWGARGRAANLGETYDQILRHYYTGTTVATSTAWSPSIGVLIRKGVNSITVRTSGAKVLGSAGSVPANSAVTITRSGAGLQLSGAISKAVPSPLVINLAAVGGAVSMDGAFSYKDGTLRIDSDSESGLRAIVGSLSMSQFLYGLAEVPSSWPAEALKAQAVAARTYAQKRINGRIGNAKYSDYQLDAAADGAYSGQKHAGESTYPAWKAAVDSTAGKAILYNGAMIDAMYSASSGGYTANSETAFVSTVPYLREVPDSEDLTGNNPHTNRSTSFTGTELGAWLSSGAVALGTVTSMTVTGAVPASGHLDKTNIHVTGTTGVRDITGAALRSAINSKVPSGRQVRSTRFTISGSASPTGPTTTQPPSPATTRPPSPTTTQPPAQTPARGAFTSAAVEGRRITISGTASDPDGAPLVRVVSTMGRERAVRDVRAYGGRFSVSWNGSPGTRNVCVTLYDNPSGRATSLGCRDVIVK